ncbi:MAG: MFS transporter [Candidatus Brocadiaceae bacterium]|jgi:MFS family permease
MNPEERGNVVRCTLCEGFFGTAINLVAPVTALPLLLEYLGAGKIMLGLSFSIASAGWFLLQPVGLVLFGRRKRTKRFLIPWSASACTPAYLGMAASVYILARQHPRLCSYLVLAFFAVRIMGGGLAVPMWFDWQAMLFRRRIRGLAIGLIAGASALGAAVAAVAAGRAQEWLGFLPSYPPLFIAAAVLSLLGLAMLIPVREPASVSAPSPRLRVRDLLHRFGLSLRQRNYLSYLVGRIILTTGAGAVAFVAVHFKSEEGGAVAAPLVVTFGLFLFLAQGIAGPVLGRLGDRMGHKAGIAVGALAQCGAIAVAYWAAGPVACAICFALMGAAFAASWVSHVNMLFETCPHDSRVAHITLSNMVLSPFIFLVPLGTGALMDVVGMRTGIGLTLVPTVLGTLWLFLAVKEPREVELLSAQEGPGAQSDAAS